MLNGALPKWYVRRPQTTQRPSEGSIAHAFETNEAGSSPASSHKPRYVSAAPPSRFYRARTSLSITSAA